MLKSAVIPVLAGVVMAGTAFFFLSAARHAGISELSLPILILTAVSLRVLASPAPATGPLAAMLWQALVFALLWRSRLGQSPPAVMGALAGLLAALGYPLVSFALGHPACRLAGTALPASVAGAPVTVAVAAGCCVLGRQAGRSLRRIINNQRSARWFTRATVHLAAIFRIRITGR